MNRILIALSILLIGIFGGGLSGYFIADGRCAKREVSAISDQIEDKNEDQGAITEKITEVRSEEGEAIETITKIKTVYIDKPSACPINDLNRVQQSIYKAFN